MCRRGHQSKPIEWDERSDEALSSFPLMMMRKITKMKITFFTILNQGSTDASLDDQFEMTCWRLCFSPNSGRSVTPISTSEFRTRFRPCTPDWNTVMFGYQFGWYISLIPWFEPRSMMWKYFYYWHDQGCVRSVIKWSTEFRPLERFSDWLWRRPNQNQLEIPVRERSNENKMRFHNSNHKTTCIFSKTSQMHIKLIHFLYIQ